MDFAMRREKAILQETLGFADIRLGAFPKKGADGLQCDGCRHFALYMSAHAVGQQQQQRIARKAITHAILVGPAGADMAFLID
jgi:hypothetical protein